MKKHVLDVGQCGFDHQSIKILIESLGATVSRALGVREALSRLKAERFDLILVNRVCEDGTSGMELVERVMTDFEKPIPVMLVSNYAEAQQQAMQRGALRGFGKSALTDTDTRTLLRDALFPSHREDGWAQGELGISPQVSAAPLQKFT